MVPVIYPINYPVIYPIIKTIFAKENGIKYLEMRAYLLNYPYKIKVILTGQV